MDTEGFQSKHPNTKLCTRSAGSTTIANSCELYRQSGQALAWLKLCQSEEYFFSGRSLRLLRDSIPSFCSLVGDIRELIVLGVGDGEKLISLDSGLDSVETIRAIDISPIFLSGLRQRFEQERRSSQLELWEGDFYELLPSIRKRSRGPCLFTALGNIAGNDYCEELLEITAGLMNVGDRLLVEFKIGTVINSEEPLNVFDNFCKERFRGFEIHQTYKHDWSRVKGAKTFVLEGRDGKKELVILASTAYPPGAWHKALFETWGLSLLNVFKSEGVNLVLVEKRRSLAEQDIGPPTI